MELNRQTHNTNIGKRNVTYKVFLKNVALEGLLGALIEKDSKWGLKAESEEDKT